MFQITKNGFENSDSTVERLRIEFKRQDSAVLRDFLDTELLHEFLNIVEKSTFVPKTEGDEGDEFGHIMHIPRDQAAIFVFHLVLNRPALFRAIEKITDCGAIGNFFGRIHKSLPNSDHQIEWHGDNADNRMIGVSINLSRSRYSGGSFQIREKDSEEVRNEIANLRLGDAFLFRISPRLQHRLMAVESGDSRTVAVGWFRSAPDWQTFSRRVFLFRSSGHPTPPEP